MVQHKIALASFFSSILLCQASPFVYEDYFAYPRYTLELTEKKLPESMVLGHQGGHIGQWNNQDHSTGEQNQVIMMTANAQPFLCTIPLVNQHPSFSANTNTKSSQSMEETRHTIERGLELLKPLETRCLYYNPPGYWSYEYCHGRYVRQFHIDPTQANNGGDTVLVDGKSSFILGNFPNHQNDDKGESPIQHQQHALVDKKQTPSSTHLSTTLRQIGGQEQQLQVLVQHWNGGTPCDLTNQPRAIDIQYQCTAQDNDHIAIFEEVSTCHYRMIIATPRLCDDLALGSKKQTKFHSIECHPVVPDYQITDHEQLQQQQQENDETQQQHQPDDESTKQPSESDSQEQQESTGDTLVEENEAVAKSDLVGMISNLAKQVHQLQRSMDQQYAMDHHHIQQQQQQHQQQHNPLVFIDQNGQWSVAPVTTMYDRDGGLTAQAFLKQFFSGGASSSPSPSFKDTPKQPPTSDEPTESQQRNRKAYEKTYYT